jgi:hypothetical protein
MCSNGDDHGTFNIIHDIPWNKIASTKGGKMEFWKRIRIYKNSQELELLINQAMRRDKNAAPDTTRAHYQSTQKPVYYRQVKKKKEGCMRATLLTLLRMFLNSKVYHLMFNFKFCLSWCWGKITVTCTFQYHPCTDSIK